MTVQDRDFDDNVYDLNAILHPGTVFDHPRDVLAARYPLARGKARHPGVLGFRRGGDQLLPRLEGAPWNQEDRVDRRHSGGPFQSRSSSPASAGWQKTTAEIS